MNDDIRFVRPRVTSVEAGESFIITRAKLSFPLQVVASCGERKHGYWWCVTHSMSFDDEHRKQAHIEEHEHKLAWICLEHGAETL